MYMKICHQELTRRTLKLLGSEVWYEISNLRPQHVALPSDVATYRWQKSFDCGSGTW